jgi:hypothetical protein
MKRIIVRYKVKADRAQENIVYVQAVFAALEKSRPAGLKYSTFQLEDGVTFIHIASIETKDGTNPVGMLDEFKAFTADIKSRCEEPPVASDATLIGNYMLL